MNIGYKVVRQINNTNEYKPALSTAHQGIRYIPNQPTMQDAESFGPITVFSFLTLAQIFAKDMSHLLGIALFKVSYEQSDENKLWKKEGEKIKTKDLSTCPRGTILARSVTLEEKIEIEENYPSFEELEYNA